MIRIFSVIYSRRPSRAIWANPEVKDVTFGRAAPLVAIQEALGEAVRDPQDLGAQLGLLLQELVGSGAIGRRQPVDLCSTLALTLLTLGRVVADVRSCSSRGRRG